MTEDQFNRIIKWQTETFPTSNPLSKLTHLKDEVEEVIDDIKNISPNVNMEFADCAILLFGAISSYGLTYNDICEAIDKKMEINRNRKWGTPDENGVVNHIK